MNKRERDMKEFNKHVSDSVKLLHIAIEAVADAEDDISQEAKEFVEGMLHEMVQDMRRARVATVLAAQLHNSLQELAKEEFEAGNFEEEVRSSLEDLPVTEEGDER